MSCRNRAGRPGHNRGSRHQARIHLWYEAHFGHPYAALSSAREGIDRFLIPGTCVGINPDEVYAPNGLALLYNGTLTPNPLTPHRSLFAQKAASYQQRWPWLSINSDESPHTKLMGPARC
ncbi:nucleotidyltransferase family protein [Pseudomonas anguilliseptica]|uniref:nucleotidyltransferase family protein n=1 Tax=Pseudomonas anguilliseptica TaxID=53406 RepID=UPI00325B0DF4